MSAPAPPEITACTRHVPALRVLPESSLKRLHQAMRHQRFQPGDRVVSVGEPLDSLVVVAQGRLKVSRISPSGREQVVRELGPGQFFGELALFTAVESEGDVVAVQPTDVCRLDREALQAELQRSPAAALPLAQALAERLAEAERLAGDLALLDVSQRLASALLRLGRTGEGAHPGEEIRFELPFSWADLAVRLGTTPESLSRRLKEFTTAGWVHVDGRRIHLREPERLHELLDGESP